MIAPDLSAVEKERMGRRWERYCVVVDEDMDLEEQLVVTWRSRAYTTNRKNRQEVRLGHFHDVVELIIGEAVGGEDAWPRQAVEPPSATKVWPVTKADMSEARNRAARAMWSGWPAMRRGFAVMRPSMSMPPARSGSLCS